ncbi:MAG: acyl carrier protein [Lachnospiraceae bacterium]|nr:acyl carrier protein [Lachnospiraceae bacterium]
MEELMEILKSLHPDIDFEKEDRLVEDMILDSFDIVTLVTEINDRFDVEILAEHLIPENFNSAQAMYELIQELED